MPHNAPTHLRLHSRASAAPQPGSGMAAAMENRPSSRAWAAGCVPLSAFHALLAATCSATATLLFRGSTELQGWAEALR